MCGHKFWERYVCLRCRKRYNERFHIYMCTPPGGGSCPIFKITEIAPLVHYDFTCAKCKELGEHVKKNTLQPSQVPRPLLWDSKTSKWDSVW